MVLASKKALFGAVALLTLSYSAAGWTQDAQKDDAETQELKRQFRELHWVKGPEDVKLYDVSTLKIPDGYVFLGTADTAKLKALEHDLGGNNQYFLAPHWPTRPIQYRAIRRRRGPPIHAELPRDRTELSCLHHDAPAGAHRR